MKTAEQILKSKLDGKIMVANNPDYTFNKVIEAMEEYASQFHPSPKEGHCPTCGCEVRIEGNTTQYYVPVSSPKEISEEEMREMAEEYQNKKANHFPYTDGDIENSYYDGLVCGLSLPSSSSKTEAVTLELKLWKTVQNDLAEIMEAKMELENYDSWVYNKIDLLEQELDKLENE